MSVRSIVICIFALFGAGVTVFGAGVTGYYTYRGLLLVAGRWRWWASWFTSGRPFSECPRCSYPRVTREGGNWIVECEHSCEVSPTRRLARFHWERRVRAWRSRDGVVVGRDP
jgi:hypothetical protein